ncbi:MAG: orotidine 5'-phosphate decarboxylase / HUMPS family protein [Nitrososphaerales archaeon]
MPGRAQGNFTKAIEKRSKTSKSRIILALDLDYRNNTSKLLSDAESMVRKTSEYLCAVKLNFHLILPLSLSELSKLNRTIESNQLTTIADIKLNDIDNTNRVASEYLWKAGFSALIANPFVGYENGLDVVLKESRAIGKGVILLAYMSHRGAEEGYGLRLEGGRTLHELFLERAKSWKADGVIMGTTRPERIAEARAFLGRDVKILSPGSGAQGGDPIKSLKAGADYLIFGRGILESGNPKDSVRQIYRSQLAWTETH